MDAFPQRYLAEAEFEFNRKPDDLAVLNLLCEANKELLLRGAKQEEEGAKVLEADIEDRRLFVKIAAGNQVTGTEAVMRIKNLITRELGKLRIGVRGVKANIKVRTAIEIDGIKREGEYLVFENVERELLETGRIREMIKKEEERQNNAKEGLVNYGHVIRQGKGVIEYRKDFHQELEERGWAKRYPAKGQWIYTPKAGEVMQKLIEELRLIAKDQRFGEWLFPRMTPIELLEKALPVYLEKIPDGMFYVCQPPRDPNAFKEFRKDFVKNGRVEKEKLKQILKTPDYVLEPAQCIPFYQYFEGQKIDGYPIKAIDVMGGWTWRNEAGGVEGILKTNEFLRMEFVYLGTPNHVIEIRNKLLEEATKLVERLGLEYRWVIGAPFYLVGDETKEGIRVDPGNLDEIPTVDLEAFLPYNNKWLEVAAFNVHRTKYTKAFRIKAKNGEELWTGCTGFGLTRWMAAVLAEKGFDRTREIFGLA